MAAYMFVSAKIFNASQFSEYGKKMGDLIKTYNGEYLAKGSISDILEGNFDKSRKILIAKYPSIEQIHDMWNSEEYKKIKKIREDIAEVDVIIIDGLK
ncbi:MAG: hypothetical protein CFH01_00567 [Alphaproteobacteria bacterium MarineAlpha2_Bin1]|nr:MAG: hypothetical protein CFH01_00567 [Alphaproteobacteria bacterium MarineAlpha2_Bin1]|tara:strand:- start:1636 stop:1929 length:294 start_codon:yes stop_codon:yes gene_type:complete